MSRFCFTIFALLLCLYSILNLSCRTTDEKDPSHKVLFTDSLKTVLEKLGYEGNDEIRKQVHTLLQLSKAHTPEDHFLVLRHYAQVNPDSNQFYIDSALRFAGIHKLDTYLSSLYILKAASFTRNNLFDSALIYTFRARDEAVKHNNLEQQANVLHLLGDLYFRTGFYEKALFYYTETQKVQGNASSWNTWRRRVVRNNIATIELMQGNPYKAIGLFHESGNEIKMPLQTKTDSLAIAYVYLLKSSGFLHLSDHEKSLVFADKALSIYNSLQDQTGLFSILTLMAELALINQNLDLASDYCRRISHLDENKGFANEHIELLLIHSQINEQLGNQLKALQYYKAYAEEREALRSGMQLAQLLQIEAENEYRRLESHFLLLRNERLLFIILFLAAVLVITLITMQHIRLRRKNRRLVSLTLSSVSQRNNPFRGYEAKKDSFEKDCSMNEERILVERLNELMRREKPYINSSFNLQLAAQMLGTNRTYLSKALNRITNQGFSTFINSYRINEAIGIISKSDTDKLSTGRLADEAGFGSRNSFVSAFVKETGMLPSTFISNSKVVMNNTPKSRNQG